MTTEISSAPAIIKAIKFNGHKIELSTNVKGQPTARNYKLLTAGKNKDQYKLLEAYYFTTEARREEWIKNLMAQIQKRSNDKAQQIAAKKAVRSNMQHSFEVGQIYYDSWGYDQTNIDFYQIIEVREKSVVIREIGAEFVPGTQGMDCSNVKPKAGSWANDPQTKPIQFYIQQDGTPKYYLKSRHGSISLYTKEDKGVYSSWYH